MSEKKETMSYFNELIKKMEKIAGKGKVLKTKTLFLELVDFLYITIFDKINNAAQKQLEKDFTSKMEDVLKENITADKQIKDFVDELNANAKKNDWLTHFGKSFVDDILKKCKKIKTDSKTGTQVADQVMKIITEVYKSYTEWSVWNQITGYWGNFKTFCLGQDKGLVDEIIDKANDAVDKGGKLVKGMANKIKK